MSWINWCGSPRSSSRVARIVISHLWGYKIKFGKRARKVFNPGYIVEEDGGLKTNGADESKNPMWVKNKSGWMRLDVLQGQTTTNGLGSDTYFESFQRKEMEDEGYTTEEIDQAILDAS